MTDPAEFEASHVHTVYNEIASDFSRTRHSRWPFVEAFLTKLPTASLVLDAGTGNGKYLGCRSVVEWQGKHDEPTIGKGKGKGKGNEPVDDQPRPAAARATSDLFNVGFDMSDGLLGIASSKGHEVVRGDCVDMTCWRRGAFNHAISIATIHHFATPERRMEAIKQMILAVLPLSPPTASSSSSTSNPPESLLLVVVWSLEQDPSLLGARSARRTTGGKQGAIEIEPLDPTGRASRRQESERTNANRGEERAEDAAGTLDDARRDREGKDVFVPWERQEQVPRKVKEPKKPKVRTPAIDADAASAVERRLAAVALDKQEPVDADRSQSPSTRQAADAAARPPANSDGPSTPALEPEPKPTFNRYYHLFSHYELSTLVQRAARSLDVAFEAPTDYPLEGDWSERVSSRGLDEEGTEGRQGREWEAYVRLVEERWERENWVVEVAVGWRRSLRGRVTGQ
ncbi:hypothetical protein JCM10212_001213 [Sporobolomyces blumeae]